jgi:proline iminopeptidase
MRKAVVGAALGAAALARARRELRNLGATRVERWKTLPGDEIVPGAKSSSTMAVTIDLPPSEVWPWLVQMGCDRAGFYSWDHLDNGGRPSATEIHPEWQTLAVGDRIVCTPDGQAWFNVERLEPERVLVLRSSIDVRRRTPFDASGPRPRFFVDGVWTFVLHEFPEGRTRLVVRSFGIARPRLLLGAVNLVFWDPAHVVMQTRQLRNLKRLVESPLQEPVLVAAA